MEWVTGRFDVDVGGSARLGPDIPCGRAEGSDRAGFPQDQRNKPTLFLYAVTLKKESEIVKNNDYLANRTLWRTP